MGKASGGDIKGFYRQTKKGGRPAAPASKSSAAGKKKTQKSAISKSAALVSHESFDLQDDCEKQEEMLRQFDLDMRYGPCLGMSRLARWERAENLGLNPPKDVESLLRGGEVHPECLWDGHV